MKYIKKFIRESYVLEYLSKIAEITKGNGKQSEFYQWQVDNAKLVDISALFKMLYDFVKFGGIHHGKIIDGLSYNTKNDKAFAVSGRITHRFMKCEELTKPRITKEEIKNIVLGGGQNLLSPERRFDAIIYSSPELFE